MHIAFIIQRINQYRTFSSLIAEGLKRNHDIECWHLCDSNAKNGGKGYLFPDPEKIPFKKGNYPSPTIHSFESNTEINRQIGNRSDITHIVTLSPPECIADEKALNQFRGKWCIIMHGPDSFKETAKLATTTIHPSVHRIFFPYTQHFFDWGMNFADSFLPVARKYFSHEHTIIKPVGCSMFDESILHINPDQVRNKYGIPEGKNIVIYLPYSYLPSKNNNKSRAWQTAFSDIHIHRTGSRRFNDNSFRNHSWKEVLAKYLSGMIKILPDSTARQFYLHGWSEPGVIDALRSFCDKNDLHLVVKPRKKFDFSEKVYQRANLIVDDDESQQYPSMLQELLCIASLGIGFFSTAVLEAVYQSVPFINIECLDERFIERDQKPWHPNHTGSLYSFDGVVWNFSPEDFINKIPEFNITHFAVKPQKRLEYMEKFTGSKKPTAAENVFNYLSTTH